MDFLYKKEDNRIFGFVNRPRVTFEIYSKIKKQWIEVVDALADTGADLTVLPSFLGKIIVDDITSGKYIEIKGIEPARHLSAFLHELKFRLDNKEFKSPVAIIDSNDVPIIFGRVEGLDRFDAIFSKGCILSLN